MTNLKDVFITDIQDKDVLLYDSATEKYLNDGIAKFKENLENNGIIKGDTNLLIPTKLMTEFKTVDAVVAELYLNDYLMSNSFNELLDGDYALSRKDIKDISKRHKGAMASGPNLGSGEHVVSTIKTVRKYVVKNPKNGNLIRAVKQADGSFLGNDNKSYTKDQVAEIKSNDAQSYNSSYHRMFMLMRHGRFDSNTKEIYKDLFKFTTKS